MRVLVIDKEAESNAKKLKEFALSRRQSIHEVMRRMRGEADAPGDDPHYMMELSDGWKVVYTVEQHPIGWFHHVSISVDSREKDKPFPHPQGVEMILGLLGVGTLKSRSHSWQEDTGQRKAINLLFPFTEPVL